MRISDWSSEVCSSDLGGPPMPPEINCRAQRRALPTRERPSTRNTSPTVRCPHSPTSSSTAWGNVPWRSEERRVGNECVRTCSSRCTPSPHTHTHPPPPPPPPPPTPPPPPPPPP